MNKIFLALVFAPTLVWAQINAQCPQFTSHGTPAYQAEPGDQELCKTNYAVIHRCSVKAPVAVFEHLTPASFSGPAKRKDNFRADPAVTAQCQATLADYATVGKTHDRGHMAPAGNNTQTDEIMSESFFLSNMVAQVANNNRGIWKQLETWERGWAEAGGDWYVISGGIFDPGYRVTGNGLGIPTRLFKVLHNKANNQTVAYMFSNTALPVADLPKYQVTLETVEQATGFRFAFR
jgi:endonuclease G